MWCCQSPAFFVPTCQLRQWSASNCSYISIERERQRCMYTVCAYAYILYRCLCISKRAQSRYMYRDLYLYRFICLSTALENKPKKNSCNWSWTSQPFVLECVPNIQDDILEKDTVFILGFAHNLQQFIIQWKHPWQSAFLDVAFSLDE